MNKLKVGLVLRTSEMMSSFGGVKNAENRGFISHPSYFLFDSENGDNFSAKEYIVVEVLRSRLDGFSGDDRDLTDFEEEDGPSPPPARIGRLTRCFAGSILPTLRRTSVILF